MRSQGEPLLCQRLSSTVPTHIRATSQKGQPPPFQNIMTTISLYGPGLPGSVPAVPQSGAIPVGGSAIRAAVR